MSLAQPTALSAPGNPTPEGQQLPTRRPMDPSELQARATLAAALITSQAVEVPSAVPRSGRWKDDPVAVRLRDLTDYLYQALAADRVDGTN
jgi:hypothetical protein